MIPDPKKVRYEVEVLGHRAPFKWKLLRIVPGGNRVQVYGGGHEGEAETLGLAVTDASIAAERLHDEWLHANTKTIEVVFQGDPKAPTDEQARELEELFQLEFPDSAGPPAQINPSPPTHLPWPLPLPFPPFCDREIED